MRKEVAAISFSIGKLHHLWLTPIRVIGLGFWFLGRPSMPVASKEERAREPGRPVVVDPDWRGGKRGGGGRLERAGV